MIVVIHKDGKSFKGAAAYLTHDPKAETAERVPWTYTLNLAHDHVPSAIDEMLWTARHAEFLKQEAEIRAGGRTTEKPVKHASLNWAHEDRPTRDHMLEMAEDFLREMKWHEHQAIVIAHDDKEHAHVHILLNAIHPETGLRLDDNFERRRASAWALEYEREHGNIRCENRLIEEQEREAAPTRPAWMAFKGVENQFSENEKSLPNLEAEFSDRPENQKDIYAREWKILKKSQREEREAFFASGKSAFREMRNETYREVREEFREKWSDYFDAVKNGGDAEQLKELKKTLVADQATMLAERRVAACDELKETRKEMYRELLDEQCDLRHGLHARQDAKLESLELMDLFTADRPILFDVAQARADGAVSEKDRQPDRQASVELKDDATSLPGHEPDSGMKSPGAIATNVAAGFANLFIDFFAGLGDSGGPRKPTVVERHEPDPKKDRRYIASEEARLKANRERDDEELRRRTEGNERSR